ncbi:MAG TPA: hypothetical protein VFD43_13830 [Planctomycetota bacterium]|nr:hypothetical protein [Planctomycetota bacterium]
MSKAPAVAGKPGNPKSVWFVFPTTTTLLSECDLIFSGTHVPRKVL